MRNKHILILLFTILFGIILNAQIVNNIIEPTLTKYSIAEKIYLQIDNTIYQTGETIWFKAVVSKSFDNSLSDISKVLHVELIDYKETIIESHLLKLNNGIANGSFVLQKGYNSGKYQIRAYTVWNRNFEEDFMFRQNIEVVKTKKIELENDPIINVVVEAGEFKTLKADIKPNLVYPNFKGKLKLYIDIGKHIDSLELSKNDNGIYNLNYKLPENVTQAELKFKNNSKGVFNKNTDEFYKETLIIDKDYLDVQFFPEGGQLVDGIISTVGFKAIDYTGLGIKVNGNIKDNNDKVVTTFASNKLGMGSFKLFSKLNTKYYAEVIKDEISYRYNLPLAKSKGSVLTLASLKNELRLSIVSKNQKTKYFIVETTVRGIKYHSFRFNKKDSIIALIPKQSLPDGIVKVSVLNDKEQKLCERLFFNSRNENRLNINLSSNKVNYFQREKVKLTLQLDSLQSLSETNLSVLVVNKKRLKTSEKYKPNLLSYLLLNSELKGFIENPNYYFDKTNKTRHYDLEALMLTQGWRDYRYSISSPTSTYNYKPETNLKVTGTVGEYFNPDKRPTKPLDINLLIFGEASQVYTQQIEDNGKFTFQLNDIYKPKTEFFMQVVDKKGEPVDFTINLDKKWLPLIKFEKQISFSIPSYEKSNFMEQMEVINEKQLKFETAYNTVALDEVNVKGYRLTPARQEFMEIHGEPTIVIDGKELVEKAPDWNYGIMSVLRSRFSDKVIIIDEGPPDNQFLRAVVRGTDCPDGFTFVLVDNIPITLADYWFLESMPVEEVTSIDILESPKNAYKYCWEVLGPKWCPKKYVALINIYTKSGNGLYGQVKTEGFKIDVIKEFSESVEFYAPSYDTLTNQDWAIPDNRSIIHWSPEITLNSIGEYNLEFYNDDHIGEVSVIVEAISKDGKIGYVEKTYTVNEAER